MGSSNMDISGLIAQLRQLEKQVPQDDPLRRELYDAARNLMFASEEPEDSIHRIAFSVNPLGQLVFLLVSSLKTDSQLH